MKIRFQQIDVIRGIKLFTFVLIVAAVSNVTGVKAANPYQDRNPATGSINVGRAGGNTSDGMGENFAVLAGNGDFSISDSSFVNGDVGVNGNHNYNGSGSGSVTRGEVYITANGHVNLSGSSTIGPCGGEEQPGEIPNPKHPCVDQGDGAANDYATTRLSGAWTDVGLLSSTAAAEAATSNYTYTLNGNPGSGTLTNIQLNNMSSMTITGAPGQKVVLQLQNFQLDKSSMVTLAGSNTTTFIIDVAKNFSLNNNSKITLMGVPAANVLFNVLPNGGDTNIAGHSQLSGIILNVNHKVALSGGSQVVQGQVLAKNVEISGGSGVVTPITNR